MEAITNFATAFGNVFKTTGGVFAGLVSGILPTLITLMTIMFFIQKVVGEERVNNFVQSLCRFAIFRYSIAPMISAILLAVPMDFVPGKFLKEEHKPGWFEAVLAQHHPLLGFFPHVHAPEIFVYLGIAQGLEKAGLPLAPFNIRILIAALVLATIRGILTERIYKIMAARNAKNVAA